jgi:hypothetical protein
MLKAVKEQLKTLLRADQQSFHAHLRQRVGKKATVNLEDRLKEIIVLMPDLISRIHRHWNRSQKRSHLKKIGGFLLAYLYAPEDLVLTEEWGLFGYLDDAYFTAKMYIQVIDELKEAGAKIAGIDSRYYGQAKNLIKYIRVVIPKETRKIDVKILELKREEKKIQRILLH